MVHKAVLKKGPQKPYAKSFYFNFHVAKYSQIMSSFTFGEHLKLFLTGTLIVITHIQSSVLWNKTNFMMYLSLTVMDKPKDPRDIFSTTWLT